MFGVISFALGKKNLFKKQNLRQSYFTKDVPNKLLFPEYRKRCAETFTLLFVILFFTQKHPSHCRQTVSNHYKGYYSFPVLPDNDLVKRC